MQIDEGFAEEDLESNLQRDKYARLCNSVNQLIDELTPSAPDFQLRDACDQLVSAARLKLSYRSDSLVTGVEYHCRNARDANAAGLFAWDASYSGSS